MINWNNVFFYCYQISFKDTINILNETPPFLDIDYEDRLCEKYFFGLKYCRMIDELSE
jgi:hypothetical protein